MTYEIDSKYTGVHRDTRYYSLVWFTTWTEFIIDGIQVVVARLAKDDQWWIIPNDRNDEANMTDLGPFETVEDAIVMMKLHAVTKQVA